MGFSTLAKEDLKEVQLIVWIPIHVSSVQSYLANGIQQAVHMVDVKIQVMQFILVLSYGASTCGTQDNMYCR